MSYQQLKEAPNIYDGVRVIGIKVSDMNLPGNEIEFNSANLEREINEKEALKRTVSTNSIVFPKRGAAIATNKKRLTTCHTVLDPNLIAVTPSDTVDHRYLFFWFSTFDLKTITAPGPTPQLNKKDIAPLKFPLPPLPEQKKIAHILSTVQRAIGAQERIIHTTTELKKALMQKFFTEGLWNEPQKQTEIGLVPESWKVVKIGDLGRCITGSTPKTNRASFYNPPIEDFIAPADIGARRYVYDSEKKISPEGLGTIRPIPKNAVMCVCIGSSIGKVGMSFRDNSATNQQINSIICKESLDPEFVYYLLSYHWEYWKGFATFGPVPILSKGRFTSIVVAIPSSMEEQQAIAKPLISLEEKIEVAAKKVTALKDLYRTLLHELMTAKVRVNDIDIGDIEELGTV